MPRQPLSRDWHLYNQISLVRFLSYYNWCYSQWHRGIYASFAASPLGHLRADVTILDDGNGIVGNEAIIPSIFHHQRKVNNILGRQFYAWGQSRYRWIAHFYIVAVYKCQVVLIAMASILPPNSLDGASYFGNNIGITHQYVYWCMQVLPGFQIRYVCTVSWLRFSFRIWSTVWYVQIPTGPLAKKKKTAKKGEVHKKLNSETQQHSNNTQT